MLDKRIKTKIDPVVLLKLASALNINLSLHITDQKLAILENAAAELVAFQKAKADCTENKRQYDNLGSHLLFMIKMLSLRYQNLDDTKTGHLAGLQKLSEVTFAFQKEKQNLLLNLPDGFSSEMSEQKYIDLLRDRNSDKPNKQTIAQNITNNINQFKLKQKVADDVGKISGILQGIRNIQDTLCAAYQECYAPENKDYWFHTGLLNIITQPLSVDDLQPGRQLSGINGREFGGIKQAALGTSEAHQLMQDAIAAGRPARELRELQPERYQKQQVSIGR